MLFHLIYVSTAVSPMGEGELNQLLQECRVNNEQHRLTGMLLYRNGHFMQVLEGDESRVRQVFDRIGRDARHKSVDVLRSEYIRHRDFPDWTMGFRDMSGADLTELPGFTRILDGDFKPAYFAENEVEAHAMLLALKDSCDDKSGS